MAVPLTEYLTSDGGYWGFDIMKKGIDWCNNNITPKFNNFHFQHSNVYNKHYNPDGDIQAQNYRFPYDNNFFDFVFLTSVFTHMLPADLENYIGEIARVLKPGGKCMSTFFLLNEESENLMKSGRSGRQFAYEMPGCRAISAANPEAAIAYDEDAVIKLCGKYGMKVLLPVYYGSWCNRKDFLTYQDMLIAEKCNQ